MAEKWLTISEAAARLGISTRTLQRRLADGDYQTKTEGNKKYVLLPNVEVNSDIDGILAEKDKLIENMSQQVESLLRLLDEANQAKERSDQTIQQMQQSTESSKERSDTIVLQLTQQVESLTKQNQLLLEDLRPKRRWYQKLFAWNGT